MQNIRVRDNHGNFTARYNMIINIGNDVFECQDLQDLELLILQHDPSTSNHSPVQVVHHECSLALRYYKGVNLERRIQLRFYDVSEVNRILQVLETLHLPIEQGMKTNQKTTSAPTSTLATYQLATQEARITIPPRPTSTANRSTLLMKQDYKPGTEFGILGVAETRPSSVPSYQRASGKPAGSFQALRPHSSSSSATMRTCSSRTPLPSPLPSYLSKPLQDLYLSQLQHTVSAVPTYHLSNTVTTQQQSRHDNLSSVSSGEHSKDGIQPITFPPSFTARSDMLELGKSGLDLKTQSDIPEMRCFHTNQFDIGVPQRPSSLPSNAKSRQDGIQNSWIPPRRVLPFPKPREKSMVNPKSISDTFPLPQTTSPSKSEARVRNSKYVAAHEPPAVSTNDVAVQANPEEFRPPATISQNNRIIHDSVSPLAGKSATASNPQLPASGLQTKSTRIKKRSPESAAILSTANVKRSKHVDKCTQTQTLSGRDHTSGVPIEKFFSYTDAGSSNRPLAVSPLPKLFDGIDNFITRYKTRPAPKDFSTTPRYSELDKDLRHDMLNDFICENLENENFLALCEDTEQAWRKLGLDL
ncbi:hypothetical protein BP5796_03892 [Coleophoma crateriformis]|uniref:Uncharacterized protein n=1 Tax=Coleophoma crateriformis TaxID=565419 RepID=A0A3D8SGU0_9HELO|nr:hypothetical protein BP5796_03892 [Coleophoma crateriformis]